MTIALGRIDHVSLRVSDVAEAAARWSIQFGLTERSVTPGRALLACDYEPYSLELLAGEPGHDHVAYELDSTCPLAAAAAHLADEAIVFEERDGSLWLSDPDGNGVELVPHPREHDPFPSVSRSTSTLTGLHPRKLGHVNFLTGQTRAQVDFYTRVLGMRVTDWLGTEGCWLHINADHHTLALVGKGSPHLHHLAFEYVDWGELRVLLDHLAQHGRRLAWGPVRHGVGRNLCAYVRVPEERLIVETYTDMEQLGADHEPRQWPDNAHSSNVWGILPPRSYFRFDDAAVAWERDQREALGEPLPPLRPPGEPEKETP